MIKKRLSPLAHFGVGCGLPNVIPFLLEAAAVLATLVHPNHIVCLCSWGFTYLPPTSNSKLFGYISRII
ncbi:hypothetical protein DLR70_08900 [Vibrio paracholerae]|uniref:Uncharacterized protein n=1 Tax=Vibrio paracholerae TaxID=650003 RepID=A0AAX1QW25_9VIBR|nr:hypothetical protein DLR70_08900 [Vibrio paracholerae]